MKTVHKFSKYEISEDGVVYSKHYKRKMKPQLSSSGYLTLVLRTDKGKKKKVRVHKLVWETYIGKVKGVLNHKNFDKTDNRLENLEDVPIRVNNLNWMRTKDFKSNRTGVRKLKNGYYRARLMVKGKTYETTRSTEESAAQWYLEKCNELKVSCK